VVTWAIDVWEGRNKVDIAKAKLEGNPTFLEELDRRGFERCLIYKLAVLTGLRRGEIESLIFDHFHFTGAMPLLKLESITATKNLKRTGTDDAFTIAPSLAPTLAPTTVKTGRNLTILDTFKPAAIGDDETKKPLDSQGKQGLFVSRGDKIRTCGLYVPNVAL
jgi:hypothetical protein